MFPDKANNFSKKQVISQKLFIKTFVTQKGLMEKYTDRVILGMAHFEFFYMQQLKENKRLDYLLSYSLFHSGNPVISSFFDFCFIVWYFLIVERI